MFSEYIERGKYIEKLGDVNVLKGIINIRDQKKHVLCNDYRKPTASACRRCKKYSKGYYIIQFYA
ncbi:10992_t:CDS:2 [Scutellospora calospora]|uniref:10992_t:CDS:1 n=1 Tax=Scutellospora calospora TaxID=85575 RepID=A0ACA9KMA5_9GLOM|nr:10992_t:CDS:2 [Scutellospora calospora]